MRSSSGAEKGRSCDNSNDSLAIALEAQVEAKKRNARRIGCDLKNRFMGAHYSRSVPTCEFSVLAKRGGEKTCKPDSVSAKTSANDGHSSRPVLTNEAHATYPPCLWPFSQSERAAQRGLRLKQGLFGLAPRRDCRVSPRLHSRLLVSVALILPSRGMGVTHSAALWSPDFPPTTHRWQATTRSSPLA